MPCIWLRWPQLAFANGRPKRERSCGCCSTAFTCSARQKADLRVIKAVFELRTMSECGFLPQLACCRVLRQLYDGPAFYLDPQEGCLLCAGLCAEEQGRPCNLDAGALYALRHICLVEDKKIFAFKISVGSLAKLSPVSGAVRADPPRQAVEELFISEIRSALTEQILKGSLLWKQAI